jgi:CheY-like chemotaxis protein
MTILLVEDSRLLRVATERMLVKAGYRVISAGDGPEALRIARESAPDLVLLDMMLPKMTGPEVLHALKHDSTTQHIPVIVLSSLSQKNEGKLLAAGAAGYLEKSEKSLDKNMGGLLQLIETVLINAKKA